MDAVEKVMGRLQSGSRVYMPGSTGENAALSEAIFHPEAVSLDLTATFVPGINPCDLASLPLASKLTAPFAFGQRGAQAEGPMRHLPSSYSAFLKHLYHTEFEHCIVQVAPPDSDGRASLGAAVEFTQIAAARSRGVIAIVNPQMPNVRGAAWIDIGSAELVVEIAAPLREYRPGTPSAVARAIAGLIAGLIPDGAALQIGLGKIPDALLPLLTRRRGLRLHSGMLSDGARLLAETGALSTNWPHVSCVHVGSAEHYRWLDGRDDFAVQGCDTTHSAGVLEAIHDFVAVNSALTVDLFGQANLETLGGRAISGVGGAADFARAAASNPSGVSVVALPATGGRLAAARIVPSLESPCSLPRYDIDILVTEFGVADLRGLSVVARAERIISIAAPEHREPLRGRWRAMADGL